MTRAVVALAMSPSARRVAALIAATDLGARGPWNRAAYSLIAFSALRGPAV
jgi:hypothetical protein